MRQFGHYNEAKAKYAISSVTISLMNSLPLLGKFTGTVIVGQLTERFGHKWTMFVTCLVQIVGAISKLNEQHDNFAAIIAKRSLQFRSQAMQSPSSWLAAF